MLFYLLLAILTFCILYLASRKENKYRSICYFAFFFIIFLVAGLRGDVGQDTYNYQLQYDLMTNFDSFIFQLSRAEPILYIIMYPYKLMFDDLYGFTGFLLLISLLQVVLLSYSTKKMHHRSTFLAIYILVIYLEYHFNVLRASLALLFFLCALRAAGANDKNKSILFSVLAVLSHLSIIVFLPILLTYFKLKKRYYIFLVAFLLVLGAGVNLFFYDLIDNKIRNYNLLDTSSFNFPVIVSVLLCFLWLTLLYDKQKNYKQVLTLAVFSLAFFFYSISTIAYRVYYIGFIVLIYIQFNDKMFSLERGKVRPYLLSVFVLCLWVTYFSVLFMVNEKSMRLKTGDGLAEFSFAPYSFYYDSKYREL